MVRDTYGAAALLSELTGRRVRRRGCNALAGLESWGAGWWVEVAAACPPALLAHRWGRAVEQAERAGLVPLLLLRTGRASWAAYWPAALHHGDPEHVHSRDPHDAVSGDPLTWWRMVRRMGPWQHKRYSG